jgi:dTDP-4-amino-4,6-dideoxygalactose transaminase
LAIAGAPPRFAEPLHVGCPNLGDRARLLERINDALDRRRLTNDGPLVREFEQRIADLVGVPHCIAVANATLGLQLAIRAMGLTGEVIVPAYTFIATAHALSWEGLTPVFADAQAHDHNLDPAAVEPLITPRTSAILAVHLWGVPCDVDALAELAARHGLRLLFDAAHAIGCSRRGTPIGGLGDAEVFSFHGTKVLNSAEGGAITTRDDELARRLRLLRNFGFAGFDNVVALGTNAKMSELSAAMGLTSLEAFDGFVAANRRNHAAYALHLGDAPGLRVLQPPPDAETNHQYVIVEVDDDAPLTRDEIVEVLKAENVLVRRYFTPGCHRSAPYLQQGHRHGPLQLPVTERLCRQVMALPTGTTVDVPQIADVADAIRTALRSPARVRALLEGARAVRRPA